MIWIEPQSKSWPLPLTPKGSLPEQVQEENQEWPVNPGSPDTHFTKKFFGSIQ